MVKLAGILLTAALGVGATACTPAPAPPWLRTACFDSSATGQADLDFNGMPDQQGNVRFFGRSPTIPSVDGTCSGDLLLTSTMDRATSHADAQAVCDSLTAPRSVFGPTQLLTLGYIVPLDAWGC